jgi:hypothetical protein
MELILILLFLLIFYIIIIYNIDSFKDINKYNINYREKYNIIEYTNDNCTKFDSKNLINQKYNPNDPNFTKLIKIHNLNSFHNFILIIDFPYYGGGTTFFINSIISKYKDKQTFLIIRTFNKNIHMYINDEYKLHKIFLEEEAIVFLYKIRNKITKIFINSIIGHSKFLIDNLLLFNDNISAITHDYSLLFDKWHLTNINNLLDNYTAINSNINIKIIKTLITQDMNNLPLYDKYLEKGKDIIVAQLPDYKNKLNKILTNNSKIVVGVLGNIRNIKGRELIVELINNNLFDVIIFGNLFVDYDKQYPYENIIELNELLIKYKPNIWIEGTLSPETYSYCLTLQMITELTILYLNKDFSSVIENRLSNYKKSISYDNIKQVIDNGLIEKHAQNYFYTISPILYYNEFWDNYFDPKPVIESFNNIKGLKLLNIIIYTKTIPYEIAMKKILEEHHKNYQTNIKYFFITFDEFQIEDIVLENGNTISFKGKESLVPGILDKTIRGFNYIVNILKIDFDYLIRSNISTVIDFNNLPLLELELKNAHYAGGKIWDVTILNATSGITNINIEKARKDRIQQKYTQSQLDQIHTFVSGACYILSNKATKYILDNQSKIDYDVIDDVAIGLLISPHFKPYELDNKMLCLGDEYFSITSETSGLIYYNGVKKIIFRNKSNDRSKDITRMANIIQLLKDDNKYL